MKRWWELIFGLPLVAVIEWFKWSVILDKFDMFVDWVDLWLFRVCIVGVVGVTIIQVTMWIGR